MAPWNYPYLTAVNAVLPALISGNAVILKHSHQTPLCAERFLEAFAAAGLEILTDVSYGVGGGDGFQSDFLLDFVEVVADEVEDL